jgi:uncharacterized membrane protein YkgB
MPENIINIQTGNAPYHAIEKQLLHSIVWFNRLALAVVFIWFGFLKIIHASPAEPLVKHLHEVTLVKFIPVNTFIVLLGCIECMIGLLWLLPGFTKAAIILFVLQMFTTFLPLFYLPLDTWQHSFVLTLEGQYIVKNIVLLASAATIVFVYIQEKKQKAIISTGINKTGKAMEIIQYFFPGHTVSKRKPENFSNSSYN